MPKTAQVRARIDPELKEEAEHYETDRRRVASWLDSAIAEVKNG